MVTIVQNMSKTLKVYEEESVGMRKEIMRDRYRLETAKRHIIELEVEMGHRQLHFRSSQVKNKFVRRRRKKGV